MVLKFEGKSDLDNYSKSVGYGKAIDDVRRLYLAPEPEVREEIKDLFITGGGFAEDRYNVNLVEAYRRGQKAGSK